MVMSVGPVPPPPGSAVPTNTQATAQPSALAKPVAAAPSAEALAAAAADGSGPARADPAAILAALAAASGGRASLALIADLADGAVANEPPASARALAAQIAEAQAPLDEDVTAAQLRASVQRSGLFLEAELAAALTAGPPAAPQIDGDLKAQLLRLVAKLDPGGQAGDPHEPAPPASAAKGPPTAADPSPLRFQAGPEASHDLREALREEVQGALARIELAQAASLPKSGPATTWLVETPLATPQGTATAQLEIRRERRQRQAAAPAQPDWRARLSVNLEPSGRVRAEVSLSGGRTRVTLWAERTGAAARLGARLDELTQALAAAEGPDVAVRVVEGAPPPPPSKSGRLLDRRT